MSDKNHVSEKPDTKECEFCSCNAHPSGKMMFNFAGRTICSKCMKKTTIPILIGLLAILAFGIMFPIIFLL